MKEKRKSRSRSFRLFTQGEFPELDKLKIQWDLMTELTPAMREANLRFLAGKMGFRVLP